MKNRRAVWALCVFQSLMSFVLLGHGAGPDNPVLANPDDPRFWRDDSTFLTPGAKSAWAHFKKRCMENAGEKITRSVVAPESIFIRNPRTTLPHSPQLTDQYWMGDPYALTTAEGELSNYLHDLDDNDRGTRRRTPRSGFAFVETPNSAGPGVLVHRLDDDRWRIVSEVSTQRRSRYAVERQDISTAEDRSHWVAGGRLAVIDLSTNEVLGERIGYVWDPGMGRGNGWTPAWMWAQPWSCPRIRREASPDRLFVEKVLRLVLRDGSGK